MTLPTPGKEQKFLKNAIGCNDTKADFGAALEASR
jgi:hypothetical protein